MFNVKLRFVLALASLIFLSACGGGTSDTTDKTNNATINNTDNTPPVLQNAVVMVSSNADLSNAHPLDGSTKDGSVHIFFQEGSDWATRGVRRVDFYCCQNSSSSHIRFPSDYTSTYGIDVDLSQYQNGNYELYIDVFFEDQTSPVSYHINFDVNNSTSGGTPNNPPTITGSPAGSVYINNSYSFTPVANDIDQDGLTFSIVNRPSWAIFDTSTGRLTGTPTSSNVGTYSNIIISVTDNVDTVSLAPFSINVMNAPAPPPTNNPPTISGSPAGLVYENSSYSFVPTAADADSSDILTFSILNMPSWATFNTSTGQLTGTPSNSDVGIYSNITIRVSDGTDTTSLTPFQIEVVAQPVSNGSISLNWTPPTTYTDNTPLTSIGGYKVYYGTSPNTYTSVIDIPNPGITTYVVENLQLNTTYNFVVTAYDANGVESQYSNSVSRQP